MSRSLPIETRKRLHDVAFACRAIRSFTEGFQFADYEASLLVRSAVERQFEIIGDALSKAAETDVLLVEHLPDLPRIVGLRNRIIHGYDSVDDELVWDIVQTKLPPLESQVTALLAEQEAGDLRDDPEHVRLDRKSDR